MVNACPPESDPRPKVGDFISNEDTKVISGLVTEGLGSLMGVVADEIRRVEPDSNVIIVDRDLLSEENITFARELGEFIDKKLSDGKKLNLIIEAQIPVNGWNLMIEQFSDRNIMIYYAALACRQTPICSKIKL